MNRRELFPILGTIAATTAPLQAADYQPRALTRGQYDLVTALANRILPTDEVSAGAGDAGAAMYIDTLLFHAPESSRSDFRKGLAAIDAADIDGSLARVAQNEGGFFGRLKSMVIDAYCLSPEGRKFLRYSGDSAIGEFKGCTHQAHKQV